MADSDTLTGKIGDPVHFAGDYLFKKQDLSAVSTGTISEECTLNNTLGSLLLVGRFDTAVTVEATKALTIGLQYLNTAGAWIDETVLATVSASTPLSDAPVFKFIPVPDNVKRKFRVVLSANGAITGTITVAIESLPRP
jgi:hypothetical protein